MPRSLHFIFHLLVTTILWNKENYFHFINWVKSGLEKINYPEPGVKLKNRSLILFFGKNKRKVGFISSQVCVKWRRVPGDETE